MRNSEVRRPAVRRWIRWGGLAGALALAGAAHGQTAGNPGGGGPGATPPGKPSPAICAYSIEKPSGGDMLPSRVDSGDDYAHAHAIGPVAQGESYATNTSTAVNDADVKRWALVHHPVSACLPVLFRSWASLQNVLRAGAGAGTGVRHGSVIKTQFLQGSVVGNLQTMASAAASQSQPTSTLTEVSGGGKREANSARVIGRDDWFGQSSLSVAASSNSTSFGAAYVVVSECVASSASQCTVHAVAGNYEMVAIWFSDTTPF